MQTPQTRPRSGESASSSVEETITRDENADAVGETFRLWSLSGFHGLSRAHAIRWSHQHRSRAEQTDFQKAHESRKHNRESSIFGLQDQLPSLSFLSCRQPARGDVDTHPADFEHSARECVALPNQPHTRYGNLRLVHGTTVRHPATLPIEAETDRTAGVRSAR